MKTVFIALAFLLVLTSCVQEIPMTRRERTPLQTKMFLAWMNHDPIIENMARVMGNLFNNGKEINLYAYP